MKAVLLSSELVPTDPVFKNMYAIHDGDGNPIGRNIEVVATAAEMEAAVKEKLAAFTQDSTPESAGPEEVELEETGA